METFFPPSDVLHSGKKRWRREPDIKRKSADDSNFSNLQKKIFETVST